MVREGEINLEKLKENAWLLGENRKKGISLVIALCASALLLVCALCVIRTGASLLDQAVGTIEEERCSQLARSFAEVLEAELMQGGTEAGSFRALACEAMERGERIRCAAEQAEEYGSLTVVIRPAERAAESVEGSGSFSWEESPEMVEEIYRKSLFPAGGFTVTVAAELDEESYVCSTAYHGYHRVQTLYFWNGEEQVYWDGEQWYADAEWTLPVEEDAGEIHWYYDAVVEETVIVPLREEGGAM